MDRFSREFKPIFPQKSSKIFVMAINFTGSTLQQDGRFSDKDRKLMASMKFPASFSKKIDMKRVNLESIRPWISLTTTSMLGGVEDDILNSLIMNFLQQPTVDPRMVQVQITPFLEAKAPTFMSVLWNLLIQAETTPNGVPPTLNELFKKTITVEKKNDTTDTYENWNREKKPNSTEHRRNRSPSCSPERPRSRQASPHAPNRSLRRSRSTRDIRNDSPRRLRASERYRGHEKDDDDHYSRHRHYLDRRKRSRSRSPN